MNTLLIILIVLIYLAIGLVMSTGADYPAAVMVFWIILLIFALGENIAEIFIDVFEKIQEWLEDKTKKMGE